MLILSLFQVIMILHIELERLRAVRVLITSVGVGSTDIFFIYSAIISLLVCFCKSPAELFFYMV